MLFVYETIQKFILCVRRNIFWTVATIAELFVTIEMESLPKNSAISNECKCIRQNFIHVSGWTVLDLEKWTRKCDPIVKCDRGIKVQNEDINFLVTIAILLLTPVTSVLQPFRISFSPPSIGRFAFIGDKSFCNGTFARFNIAIIMFFFLFLWSERKKRTDSNISLHSSLMTSQKRGIQISHFKWQVACLHVFLCYVREPHISCWKYQYWSNA